MEDYASIAKVAADLGGVGLAGFVLFIFWRGAKDYAPKFIRAQTRQTAAIRRLASNISTSQEKQVKAITATADAITTVVDDQREALIVMRSISNELREMRDESREADVEARQAIDDLRRRLGGGVEFTGGAA